MFSMTGYTKQDFKIQGASFSIIINSLNSSKGLDLSIKMPWYFSSVEHDVRKLINKKLVRGKISFRILENHSNNKVVLNKKQLKAHMRSIIEITPNVDLGAVLNAAIKLPDIFISENFKFNRVNKKILLGNVDSGIKDLNLFRKKEGAALMKEIRNYINSLIKLVKQISTLEKKRISKKKDKIQKLIKNSISKTDYNSNRLEAEMIYYFERNDITEERIRLHQHCNFFLDIIKTEGVMGKKLIFISQEILREINTIGSKAHDFEIQKRVVAMKEEIEKTKEQLQNIL